MQAMPEYGPERMGAPIKAFTRISEEPIDIHCNIEKPNVVIVLDETLLDVVDVAEGLTDDGASSSTRARPPTGQEVLGLADTVTVACVDASGHRARHAQARHPEHADRRRVRQGDRRPRPRGLQEPAGQDLRQEVRPGDHGRERRGGRPSLRGGDRG